MRDIFYHTLSHSIQMYCITMLFVEAMYCMLSPHVYAMRDCRFENKLNQIFEHINSVFHDITSRMRAENFKVSRYPSLP